MSFYKFIFFLILTTPTFVFSSPQILAIGDSLTEGYQLSADESYPHQLKLILQKNGYKNVEVINAGISGATTAIGLNTLKFHLKNKHYDLVIYCLGANDGLRGRSVKNTRDNIENAIKYVKSKEVRMLLVGMRVPPNYGTKYTEEFKKIYPELSKKHNIELVPFLLKGVAAEKSLNLPDGIHPNAKGYKIVANNVAKQTLKLLKTIKAGGK